MSETSWQMVDSMSKIWSKPETCPNDVQKMFEKWGNYKVYPEESNKLGEWQKKKDEIIKVLKNT